jgi:hypothetical protein
MAPGFHMLARSITLGAGISQRHLRVSPDGEYVFLPSNAIAVPPQLGAVRANLEIKPTAISELERSSAWLGLPNL